MAYLLPLITFAIITYVTKCTRYVRRTSTNWYLIRNKKVNCSMLNINENQYNTFIMTSYVSKISFFEPSDSINCWMKPKVHWKSPSSGFVLIVYHLKLFLLRKFSRNTNKDSIDARKIYTVKPAYSKHA